MCENKEKQLKYIIETRNVFDICKNTTFSISSVGDICSIFDNYTNYIKLADRNNIQLSLLINEKDTEKEIISSLKENDKQKYNIIKLNFIFESNLFYLDKIKKCNMFIDDIIKYLEKLFINSFDEDIHIEVYNESISLLNDINNYIILIEIESKFSEKIKNYIKKININDKIKKFKNILNERSIKLRLIFKTKNELLVITNKIKNLDYEILNELPKIKQIGQDKYYKITDKLQIICNNYDKIQRNSSSGLKHSLINYEIMMGHYNSLSQKFTESQVHKNENSGSSYY